MVMDRHGLVGAKAPICESRIKSAMTEQGSDSRNESMRAVIFDSPTEAN